MSEAIPELHDKIEALEAELFEAVSVAYNRGAVEWTKRNYPAWFERLKVGGGQPANTLPHQDKHPGPNQ